MYNVEEPVLDNIKCHVYVSSAMHELSSAMHEFSSAAAKCHAQATCWDIDIMPGKCKYSVPIFHVLTKCHALNYKHYIQVSSAIIKCHIHRSSAIKCHAHISSAMPKFLRETLHKTVWRRCHLERSLECKTGSCSICKLGNRL